jgi:hypothetical protein
VKSLGRARSNPFDVARRETLDVIRDKRLCGAVQCGGQAALFFG